jgi:hypothetical protein
MGFAEVINLFAAYSRTSAFQALKKFKQVFKNWVRGEVEDGDAGVSDAGNTGVAWRYASGCRMRRREVAELR